MNSPALLRLALAGCLMMLASASAQEAKGRAGELSLELRRGRELAQKYFAVCHLFPEPELADEDGVDPPHPAGDGEVARHRTRGLEGMADGKILQEAAVFPSSPIIAEEDWFAIWDYYRAAAPKPSVAASRETCRPRRPETIPREEAQIRTTARP